MNGKFETIMAFGCFWEHLYYEMVEFCMANSNNWTLLRTNEGDGKSLWERLGFAGVIFYELRRQLCDLDVFVSERFNLRQSQVI